MLAGLVHGPELSSLTVYIATLDQRDADVRLGCARLLREQPPDRDRAGLRGITARAVVTHEYGHHVANNRDNAPGRPSTRARSAGRPTSASAGGRSPASSPRATRAPATRSTPARRFAEDYRVLNERRARPPGDALGGRRRQLLPRPDRARPARAGRDLALDGQHVDAATPGPSRLGHPAAGSRSRHRSTGASRVTLTSPRAARLTLRLVDPATHQVLASSTGTARVEVARSRGVRPADAAGAGQAGEGRRRLHARGLQALDAPIPFPGRAPWPSG